MKELSSQVETSIVTSNNCTTMMCEINGIAKVVMGTGKLIVFTIAMSVDIPRTFVKCIVIMFKEVFPRKLAKYKENNE